MPVPVVRADTDHGEPWSEAVEKGSATGRGTAMVRDLEHVPASAIVGQQGQEVLVAVVLDIASEEHALPPDADSQHDRGVVDGSAIRQRDLWQPFARRPQDLDMGDPDIQLVALREADPSHAGACGGRA
jgi:hypothetical protein